ncbi:DNA cytosine methyltransferase [Paenibacillus sedimenti]|uniref:DNA (cytosine-5-)-methyltransferase n=1 Tax=Paenibacillus sedimenti TaxID=2770274 RepID=A0A926QMD6_9BACL|nr:DNA cytosine methyltransferase [Paenibacillus sedimenti]MBD0383274.1 DNA cytosine methyltransferase [Paenibacillus sedimenti]
MESLHQNTYSFLEFFAGSGLVAHALKPYFKAVWANDICEKKAAVYVANHGKKHFHLNDIQHVCGLGLPHADLSWASFPCQDLSLAGLIAGIEGKRSGLVWEWLRIMDEMPKMPPILVAENVVGLVSSKGGQNYKLLHEALRTRGYKAGAIILDAVRWVPQSRPRVFVIAVKKEIKIPESLISDTPNWLHNEAVKKASNDLKDWIWWRIPEPDIRKNVLADIIEWDAPVDNEDTTSYNLSLVPPLHLAKLKEGFRVAAGYKRTRNKKQVLELRVDGVAGCLRTPEGGSSRQYVVLNQNGALKTRLLTTRETARLMGAPDSYKLPGTYNNGYKAMGDAVAAPVAQYLSEHLLFPLAEQSRQLKEREFNVNVG